MSRRDRLRREARGHAVRSLGAMAFILLATTLEGCAHTDAARYFAFAAEIAGAVTVLVSCRRLEKAMKRQDDSTRE